MTRKISGIFAFAFILWSSAGFADTNAVLYSDNFEIYPNGTPLIDNVSNKYWYASDTNAIVQTNFAAIGSTNAAMIPIDVTLSNRFAASTSTNIWLHMQPKIVLYNGSTNVTYDTNSTAVFYFDSNAFCVVRNGAVGWTTVTTADPIDTNSFVPIDVYLDYSAKTWRLKVNSTQLTNNIGFVNTSAANLTGFDVYNGGLLTSYLDNVWMYDKDALPVLSFNPSVLTNTQLYNGSLTTNYTSFDLVASGDGVIRYNMITNSDTYGWRVHITTNATGSLTNDAANRALTNIVNVVLSNYVVLNPGTYNNSIGVISTNVEGQITQTVDVIFIVRGMTLSPTNLTRSYMLGFAGDTQSFAVINSGDTPVNYNISTNPATQWLSVSPGTGMVTAQGGINCTNTHYVSYFTNSLTVGTVTSTLAIADLSSGSVTQNLGILMTTYSPPMPTVSSNNYSRTIQKAQLPASITLSVWNAGSAPMPRMNYEVTSDVAWLPNPGSGTTYTSETNLVVVNFAAAVITNYSGGSYTGRLTVTGIDAGPTNSYSPVGRVTNTTQVTVSVRIISPGKPGGFSATKGTYADSVHLAWTTTTNLNHFELWQGTNTSVSNATRFVASAGTATSYTDTGTLPGIIYYYWVRAVNDYGGAGDYSASDTGWRSLPASTGLTASDGDFTNKVALSWTASDGAQTYEIWRNDINLTNTAVLVGTVSSALTAYDDTSAIVETPYYYWIKSRTPYMGTFGDPDTGYRAMLMKPTGVIATDGDHTNMVRVIWQAVDQATSYDVWRSASTDRSAGAKIGESTALGYDDTSATQGIYLYYWVRAARSGEGYSIYSDYDAGWRQLAAPVGIVASDGTYPYRVKVSWTPSENAASYEVLRGQGPGVGEGAKAGILKLDETVNTYYNDHATVISTLYNYRVRAMSALGGASADSSSDDGWREIDPATTTLPVQNDYDGDKLADLPFYNSTSGVWQILLSIVGQYDLSLGSTNSHGVQGDYDGDGLSDPMVYAKSGPGIWAVMLSSIGYFPIIAGSFGGGGADSAPADYDGDGITDLVVYNETGGYMSALLSNGGAFNAPVTVSIGGTGWTLVSADYDGDGKADPSIYSASTGQLIVKLSGSGYVFVPIAIGGAGITMHPADYDGDNKADLVTYEEATGGWIFRISAAGYTPIPVTMGGAGYRPFVADYDGDTKIDPAVFSESTGDWLIRFSGHSYILIEDNFGGTNNVPIGRQ